LSAGARSESVIDRSHPLRSSENGFIEKIKCISMTLFIAHSEKRVINYPPQVLGSLTTGKIPKVDTLIVFGH